MSTCTHGNTAPDQTLDELHESQAGMREGVPIWRHKCCECAFAAGEEAGKIQAVEPTGTAHCQTTNRSAPYEAMDALPKSQGRRGRHKCAICAYHAGFARGRALVTESAG